MSHRIGIGFDVHPFQTGRKLVLGGVEVPFSHGLEGHSDADVLLHAICDAMLGAAALGDLGRHFPDTEPKFKNISSLLLLAEVVHMISERGYSVENIDATVIAENPKLTAYFSAMSENIRNIQGLGHTAVNIKATTTEGLGFTGRGEGIAAQAIVLLSSTNS